MDTERKLVDCLLACLAEAYEGSPGHAFKSVVQGLTQAEATWTPPGYHHPWGLDGSSLAIITHLGTVSVMMHDRIFGSGQLSRENILARFEADGADLAAALRLAETGYRALRGTLDALCDEDLNRTCAFSKDWTMTLEQFFARMVEHHTYHAGQLQYVRTLNGGKA